MVRTFPFREMSARPAATASAVMQRTSETRMPVAQMVSMSRASRARPALQAASSSRRYSDLVSSRSGPRKSLR